MKLNACALLMHVTVVQGHFYEKILLHENFQIYVMNLLKIKCILYETDI